MNGNRSIPRPVTVCDCARRVAGVALIGLLAFGSTGCMGADSAPSLPAEAGRLQSALGANSVSPLVIESGFREFSAASKNELVAWLAQRHETWPSGKVLARLPFILTPQNKVGMGAVFLRNLRSPSAEARTSCLYGLERLAHPQLQQSAEMLLRDEWDDVLVAACTLLVPQAAQDPRVWKQLHGLYVSHSGQTRFHASNALLEAHGLDRVVRPAKP